MNKYLCTWWIDSDCYPDYACYLVVTASSYDEAEEKASEKSRGQEVEVDIIDDFRRNRTSKNAAR
jgi:hypothetical protein